MKRKCFILSVIALLLIACAVIKPAVAYFTDNAYADGAIPLYFGRWTEISETVKDLTKSVTITNTGGEHPEKADPVWIRAKASTGTAYELEISGDGWYEGEADPDDPYGGKYWYYNAPVPVGGSTTALKVTLKGLPTDQDDAEFPITSVAVGVVYESTTAFLKEDAPNPGPSGYQPEDYQPADWSAVLDYGETGPGAT